MKFTDIPRRKFPLNSQKHYRLQQEIQAIADRFDDLGTSDGHAVFRQMIEVRARLDQTWQLIQQIEHRERGR
ncbi:hypothetical protein [Agrobacterium pusense]|uniref:hypothetical protein n=1 Tax=Agrobacterium pusense TaxID=648995 RepID=UPI0005134B67|nr:hypothetical protein [Agrobacterium pusense]ANV24589.1 hypothetical protein BA939_11970 [Rhizobium sp. S41]KGE82922.1 hypothetical protein LW14_10575 [Rhizobium sp. H41]QWW74271.1 hypothetical protein KP800_01835 [Agrobacterium pusense]